MKLSLFERLDLWLHRRDLQRTQRRSEIERMKQEMIPEPNKPRVTPPPPPPAPPMRLVREGSNKSV